MHARQKHIHFFKFNKLNVYIKCHDRKNSDFINLLYKYYIAYISFIISTLATNYSNNKHTVLQEKIYYHNRRPSGSSRPGYTTGYSST